MVKYHRCLSGRRQLSTLIAGFLLLGLLTMSLHAQEKAVLNGYIKDARSGETLIQANAYFPALQQGTTTNNSGYYIIPDLAPGTYQMIVAYIGYTDYAVEITLAPGEKKRLDIELSAGFVEGEEIVVEEEKTIEEEKEVGVLTIQPAQIKELPAVFEADLFRSIQLLPGIKAASDFSSGLYVRGGSPDQTLILMDRTTVYNPTHFFGFFSTFNPDAIKDVRIYKGGYPAEYGGRLGAVIDIFNRDGNRKEFQGRASVGLLASRVNLEGPMKKGSWMVAVRRSTLEPLLAALRGQIDDIPDAFYFYDVNGKINYDPTPNDRLNLSFYAGTDKVLFPFADDAEFDLNYGNNTISANWTHVFSRNLFSNLTATRSSYFSTPELNFAGTNFTRDNTVEDLSLKGDFEYIPSSKHEVKAGFWVGDLAVRIEETFDRNNTLTEKIESQYVSAYSEYKWRPRPQWIVTGGVRGNYATSGSFFRTEPRLSMEFIYSQQLLLQAAYGRYYQFLTLITNEAFAGFDTWLTTDEGVEPAWGDQFVLGMKSRPSESYSLDIELYYRSMRQLFELDPRIQDSAGLDYRDLFRFGEGFAYGAEFMLEKVKGRWTGFVGYTWGTSRRKFPNYNNNEFYPPKYDRIHDINIVANYQLSKKWRMTGVFSYATGQAYTEVLGNYYVNFPTASEARSPFVVGTLNNARLPAYHRMDIGFTRSSKLFGKLKYQLQLQIINLYSRRNIWFLTYDFNDNPLSQDEVQMLPIIPNISMTFDF